MGKLILKQKIVDKIKNDGVLFGKVCAALGIKPSSLPQMLYPKNPRLTQLGVIRILKDHLGIAEDNELLEEISETAAA